MSICYQCDLCGSVTGKDINAMKWNKRMIRCCGDIEYSGWNAYQEIQVCDNCAFKMFDAATDGKFSSGELMFKD